MTAPLLPQIAAGDQSAMQECIDRYGALVWSLARRWSTDSEDAEDAVQEVFISLWQSASRFDPKIASEPSFITMIARRRLIDRGRKLARRRKVEVIQEDEAPEPSVLDSRAELASEAEVAEQALGELRPEQQQVLRLAIYEGLTHQEISGETGLPLGTVKTHARRGLIRIRQVLAGETVAGKGSSP